MMNSVRFPFRTLILATATTGAMLLTGCKDQSIRVYSVPKEVPQPAPAAMAQSEPTEAQAHLHWEEIPPTWESAPVTSMRAASFRVLGPDGEAGDVGAIPLPVVPGLEGEIVNMWRGELELPETTTNAIAALRQPVIVAGSTGVLYDLISEKPLINDDKLKRVLMVKADAGNSTWFFKLTGSDQLVSAEKENYLNWLASLEFHEGTHEAPATSVASSPGGTGLPNWNVPQNWVPTQPGQMLLASFALPGGDAQVTVSSLSGDGGGLLPNINRWRGQLGLAPIDESGLQDVTTPIETADGPGMLVDLDGGEQRMLTVIIPHNGRSWFYKSMGRSDIVDQERDAFVEFVRTANH